MQIIFNNYSGLTLLNYPINVLLVFSFILMFTFTSLKSYKILFNTISKHNIILVPVSTFIIYISIIFNLVLIDIVIAKTFIYLSYISLIVFTLINFLNIKILFKNLIKKNSTFFKKKKFELIVISILVLIYFLLSILPISDADSLNYHSGFASIALQNENLEFLKKTEIIDFNFFFVGFGEIINFIGISFGVDNFGSVLNFFSLILISTYLLQNYKKNVYFVILSIFSSPILIPLITSQKGYLLPITLLSIIFLNIYKRKIQKVDYFLLIVVISFTIGSKTSMIPFAFLIYLILGYLSFKQKNFLFFLKSFLIASIIVLFPFFLKNLMFHGDIFPPFTRELFNLNSNEASEFAKWIRSYDVNLTLKNLLYLPFLFLIPHFADGEKIFFSITQITKIYGVQFYNFVFVKNLHNLYIFLILSIFLLILVTSNISTRWFLLIFLLTQYSLLEFKFNNNFYFKILIYLQSLLVIFLLIIFTIFSYYLLIMGGKDKFYDQFSYGYSYSKKIEKLITKFDLNKDDYLLHSHRSKFWNNYKKNFINYGNDYNELYQISNNHLIFNTSIKEDVIDKNIKIFILKGNFENLDFLNFNNNCEIKYGKILDKRQTRNPFHSGKKEYTYVYFVNRNLFDCINDR